jgi:hypothetical protein
MCRAAAEPVLAAGAGEAADQSSEAVPEPGEEAEGGDAQPANAAATAIVSVRIDSLLVRNIGLLSDPDRIQRPENTGSLQQPDQDGDYDDHIEYSVDLPVHRNVVINKPQQYADDDEYDGHMNERHLAVQFSLALRHISGRLRPKRA